MRPFFEYPTLSESNYGWLVQYKKTTLSVTVNNKAEKFISKDAAARYLKLKLRSFIGDYKIIDVKESKIDNNYISLEISLHKYNDKIDIYYGRVSLTVNSAVSYSQNDRVYKLTMSIAGSENQILRFIKDDIDLMVEALAEDYYSLSDLQTQESLKGT